MVDEADAADIGSYEEIKRMFSAALPALSWDDSKRCGRYEDAIDSFEVRLFLDAPIHNCISATGHSQNGFKNYLMQVCEAVGLFAADRGRVLGGNLRP